MAISVTEILGTDSVSGSRIVINDNFRILATEINAMEVYFSPSAASITNLSQITVETLTVGLSSPKLTVGSSSVAVTAPFSVSAAYNATFNGRLLQASQDATSITSNTSLGTTSAAPTYDLYRVSNSSTGNITINLFEGLKGQEITIVAEAITGSGDIVITAGSNTSIVGATSITLDTTGETIVLKAVTDSAGTGQDWYVVGGQGYVLA